jgi:hypothetical protein
VEDFPGWQKYMRREVARTVWVPSLSPEHRWIAATQYTGERPWVCTQEARRAVGLDPKGRRGGI